MPRFRLLGLWLPMMLMPALCAAEEPGAMRLASLEWMPYAGASLAQDGLSGAVVAAATRQLGYRIKVDYFPWNRAVRVGSTDPAFAGYFPAYYTEERAPQCHFSAPIGVSTLGLAHPKSMPLQWDSLTDLRAVPIGIVSGYSNGDAFDTLSHAGKLNVDPSPSDLLNLKKLLANRVRAVAIDKSTLRYLLLTEPALAAARDRIVFHERPLAALALHVCFQRTPDGKRLQQAFDAALQRVDQRKIEHDYFQRLENKHAPPRDK